MDRREDLAAFGRNVRQRRRELGLTQEALAGELGFSAPYLSEIESGRRDVGLTRLVALARALGSSLDELVLGDAGVPEAPAVDVLAKELRELPKSRRDAARLVVEALRKLEK
jgi:transcriptional regulator with XRE-family HTH domain